MTEQKFSSPINHFMPSVPSSARGSSALGATDRSSPSDFSFSRELTRASGKSQSSRESFDRPRRDDPFNVENRTLSRSEDSRRTHQSETSSSEGFSKKAATKESRSGKEPPVNASRSTENSRAAHDSKSEDTVKGYESEVRHSDRNTAIGSEKEYAAGEEVAGSDKGSVSLDTLLLPAEAIAEEDTLNLSITETEAENTEGTEDLSNNGTTQADNSDGLESMLGKSLKSSADTGALATQRLSTNEHVSPGQLANRQAHLMNNAVIRDSSSALPVQLSVAERYID